MKRFLFVIAAAIVTLVACDVSSEIKPKSNLRITEEFDGPGTLSVVKIRDDVGQVTCYMSWTSSGNGLFCFRDEK
jgi:hypothetical protein